MTDSAHPELVSIRDSVNAMAQRCSDHDRRIAVLEARQESQISRTDEHSDDIKRLRADIQGMTDRISDEVDAVRRALTQHAEREDRDRVEMLRRQIQQMIATAITLAAVVIPYLLHVITGIGSP